MSDTYYVPTQNGRPLFHLRQTTEEAAWKRLEQIMMIGPRGQLKNKGFDVEHWTADAIHNYDVEKEQ